MRNMNNYRGSALLSVIIAGVIGMIIMFSMMSFFNSAGSFQKDMRSKIDFSNLQQALAKSLSDPQLCTQMFANKAFSTRDSEISFTDPIMGEFRSGKKINDIPLKSVTLQNVKRLYGTTYGGNIVLRVDGDQGPSVRDRRLPIHFVVNGSRIERCSGSGYSGAVSTCPPGEVLIGQGADGSAQCRSIADVMEENAKTKTYYLRFYNGTSFKNQFVGEVYLHEDELRLVSVSTPAGRNTKFAVSVKEGKVKVEPAPGFNPQVCFYHKGHAAGGTPPCLVTGKDDSGNKIYNCGLPVGWIGATNGNTKDMGAVNCGNWGSN